MSFASLIAKLTSISKQYITRESLCPLSSNGYCLTDRTLLKLNAYYAFPALSNGEPQEPYTSTCLSSIQAIVELVNTAREVGFQTSSSPLFIWSSWVGARVIFGEPDRHALSRLSLRIS